MSEITHFKHPPDDDRGYCFAVGVSEETGGDANTMVVVCLKPQYLGRDTDGDLILELSAHDARDMADALLLKADDAEGRVL